MGCDPDFQYADKYVEYIHRCLDDIFVKNFQRPFAEYVINEGIKATEANDFDCAAIYFRGALMIDENQQDALYCYARACKDSYEIGEEEEYVARYKAEALEAFECLTMESPDFADGFYFLGYAYLNLGLYIKAKLTWEEFMKLSQDDELKKEINERLKSLDDPVEIEKAYNLIISGNYQEGYDKLSRYKVEKYDKWWPMWYYLGIAAKELGNKDESIEHFQKVLTISPSNIETMKELIKLYDEKKQKDMVKKYTDKIKIIEENILKDKEIKELGEKHGVNVVSSLDDLPGAPRGKIN